MECCAGPLKLAVFGVFDGHGGKQAAVYASRHLHSNLQAALAEYTASSSEPDSSDAAAANDGQQAAAEETEAPRTSLAGLNGPTALAACDDADRVAAALPRALAAAFAATEQAFVAHSQVRAVSHRSLLPCASCLRIYRTADEAPAC